MVDSAQSLLSCRIDAHVHITGPGALESLRTAGVTAARDAGTTDGAGLALERERRDKGTPAIQAAGWALCRKGGYGMNFGRPVATDQEIRDAIAALRKAGAGIIKVMASGIVSLSNPDRITAGGFSAEHLQMIVAEAHALGLAVMAHANGEEAIIHAACAGVRSVEHGFHMTDRALAALAERGVWWVPTVGALQRAADNAAIPDSARQRVNEVIANHLAMVGKAHAIGVMLAIGTDAVLPDPRYDDHYEAELKFFRRAGVPDAEVSAMACESGKALLALNST